MEHFSATKAHSVARTASIEIETSAASAVRDACCSRGIALHLSAAFNRKVCLMRCIKSNCKFRKPNKNPMDYYSYYLKHYYYWL